MSISSLPRAQRLARRLKTWAALALALPAGWASAAALTVDFNALQYTGYAAQPGLTTPSNGGFSYWLHDGFRWSSNLYVQCQEAVSGANPCSADGVNDYVSTTPAGGNYYIQRDDRSAFQFLGGDFFARNAADELPKFFVILYGVGGTEIFDSRTAFQDKYFDVTTGRSSPYQLNLDPIAADVYAMTFGFKSDDAKNFAFDNLRFTVADVSGTGNTGGTPGGTTVPPVTPPSAPPATQPTAEVPEPASLPLLALGVGALAWRRRARTARA